LTIKSFSFFLLSSIVVIVLLGIMSVLLYNFFITSSNEIRTISLQGVINGSKIQTFNMKNSIEDKFQIITSNLKLWGDSPLTKTKKFNYHFINGYSTKYYKLSN
jgi:hypothetical protein